MNTLQNVSKGLKIASCAMTAMHWLDKAKKLTVCVLAAASVCTVYHIATACMEKRVGE